MGSRLRRQEHLHLVQPNPTLGPNVVMRMVRLASPRWELESRTNVGRLLDPPPRRRLDGYPCLVTESLLLR